MFGARVVKKNNKICNFSEVTHVWHTTMESLETLVPLSLHSPFPSRLSPSLTVMIVSLTHINTKYMCSLHPSLPISLSPSASTAHFLQRCSFHFLLRFILFFIADRQTKEGMSTGSAHPCMCGSCAHALCVGVDTQISL